MRYYKIMELTKEQKQALALVAKKYQLQLVLLFGSLSTGKARKESDADVAVLAEGKRIMRSFGAFLELIEELSSIFKREVDLSLLNTANPLLLHKVSQQAELLFGSRKDFIKFRLHAFHRYNDYLPYFKIEAKLNKTILRQYVNG